MTTETAIPTIEEMALTVDEAAWELLRPHLERDALILVDTRLELAEVGHALASDNAPQVREWLAAARIGKPSAPQIAAWEACCTTQLFLILIVQPYILIQEIPRHVQ